MEKYGNVWKSTKTHTSLRLLTLPMGGTFHGEQDWTIPRSPRALRTLVVEVHSFQESVETS